MKKGIPDSWLFLSIIAIGIYFFIRLIDQAKMLSFFPLDFSNDYSSHMAQLYFLGECGFHNLCGYWYNGYTLFEAYTPLWYTYTDLFFSAFNNILHSTYFSVISLFLLAFIIIFLFGKLFKLSIAKRIVFFLFLFANPVAIGNFIRLGRVTELISWVVFLVLAFMIFWYKDHKLDWKFLLFIPFYFLLMLGHPMITILFHILLLSLLLVKTWRERLIIIGSILLGLLASAFWWIPYLISSLQSTATEVIVGGRFWELSGTWFLTNIVSFIVPLALWIVFFWYVKDKNKKREFTFFFPIFILSLLVFFRITPFIPGLQLIYPDPYTQFFLFFLVFYFLSINLKKISKISKVLILLGLLLVPILSIGMSLNHTPWFADSYDEITEETLTLLPLIPTDEKFIINQCEDEGCCKLPGCRILAIYAYAPIYYDLSTPNGYSSNEIDSEYLERLNDITYLGLTCDEYIEELEYFETDYIISYVQNCDALKACGLEVVESTEHACLLKV
ncbi:hypothetical protein HOD38_01085 [archaeon]|jgi:hypothetical protein|nr:hypothetical protein [archaeon]MBT4396838.1 hypothetical protein [archaeon]MBT4441484.1 hypothetical protein [archaeon]